MCSPLKAILESTGSDLSKMAYCDDVNKESADLGRSYEKWLCTKSYSESIKFDCIKGSCHVDVFVTWNIIVNEGVNLKMTLCLFIGIFVNFW